jgi:hypothetical protein
MTSDNGCSLLSSDEFDTTLGSYTISKRQLGQDRILFIDTPHKRKTCNQFRYIIRITNRITIRGGARIQDLGGPN